MQLLHGEVLFKRAMSMSGDPTLRPIQKFHESEEIYAALAEEMGVGDSPKGERLRVLRSLPWEKLIASPLNTRCFPTEHGGYVPKLESPKDMQQQIGKCLDWCTTIVVGDCKQDVRA